MTRARLGLGAVVALAVLLGCAHAGRPARSLSPRRLPVVYVDQRTPTGFAPARRAPPLRKRLPFRPTLAGRLRLSLPRPGGQSFAPQPGAPPGAGTLDPLLQWALGAMGAAVPWGAWPLPTNLRPPPTAQPSAPQSGCGVVMIGADAIPLDCNTPGYGAVRGAAFPMVSYRQLRASALHAGAAELPDRVDHREEGTEGPVRHQGGVGACSGFSFAAAIDHGIAQEVGEPGNVSVMHLWSRYHEPSMKLPVERNKDLPLTREEWWPYTKPNQDRACSWVPRNLCPPECNNGAGTCGCRKPPSAGCGVPVDGAEVAHADAAPFYFVRSATTIQADTSAFDREALMDVLAKGQDLWMSMGFHYDAFSPEKLHPTYDGLAFVVPDFRETTSAHAMLLTGYVVKDTGVYFLLKNSWGESWGDRGYAWIHETTLGRHLQSAYVVQAELSDPRLSPNPPRNPLPTQCAAGLLPDSITGQCVPPCPDASPRQNGICSEPGDCPPGYVNLTGQCVVAAPSQQGRDPATGTTFQCAAAGCTYYVPYGPYCALPFCALSCPSPRFRLVAGPGELGCSE